ncbi:MAG: CoA transferase [Betaproteobacteria bacterium]
MIDGAMVDGASLLATHIHGLIARGEWNAHRGTNTLDGGAPWYDVYETKDGRYVAVGAIEPAFYSALLEKLGLDAAAMPSRSDRASWPAIRERLAAVFKTRDRDAWAIYFEDSDACVTPVLSFEEARRHPQAAARSAFATVGSVAQPAPGPRFSRTPGVVRRPPPSRGEGARRALVDWGFELAEAARLAPPDPG